MLRRDYILRMIEDFMRVLARVTRQKDERDWDGAEGTLEEQARELTGLDLETLASLSDTEIFARLLRTGDSQSQRERTFMLGRVLVEAADLAALRPDGPEQSRALRLKALHLLLNTALRSEDMEWPQFVPSIDMLAASLGNEPLPLHSYGLLMQHYERSGQFAKAEDALFAAIEIAPESRGLLQLGVSFYHRLLGNSDSALEDGGLPRAEVETGLAELESRAREWPKPPNG